MPQATAHPGKELCFSAASLTVLRAKLWLKKGLSERSSWQNLCEGLSCSLGSLWVGFS